MDNKADKKLLEKRNNIFPIAKYDFSNFKEKECVSFIGSPAKHPNDDEKFILICNPLSDHTQFLEFNKSDAMYIEELSSVSSKDGESIHMVKAWIKNGVVALKYEPFIVGKTSDVLEKLRR